MMKVIPETRRAHLILYLRFYFIRDLVPVKNVKRMFNIYYRNVISIIILIDLT